MDQRGEAAEDKRFLHVLAVADVKNSFKVIYIKSP